MSIHSQCPTCGRKVKAPDAAAGKRVKCPQCLKPFTVPAFLLPDATAAADAVGHDAPSTSGRTIALPLPLLVGSGIALLCVFAAILLIVVSNSRSASETDALANQQAVAAAEKAAQEKAEAEASAKKFQQEAEAKAQKAKEDPQAKARTKEMLAAVIKFADQAEASSSSLGYEDAAASLSKLRKMYWALPSDTPNDIRALASTVLDAADLLPSLIARLDFPEIRECRRLLREAVSLLRGAVNK